MYCRKCGGEIMNGDLFCPQCGSQTNSSNDSSEELNKEKGNRKILKIVLFILGLLLLSVLLVITIIKLSRPFKNIKEGETVILGEYNSEPIEWICIETKWNKALLVSKYVLDIQPIILYENDESTWEKSYLREWLNEEFYDEAFSQKEQKSILTTNIEKSVSDFANDRDEIKYSNTAYGPQTKDKVFILSEEEIENYLNYKTVAGYFTSNQREVYWVRTVYADKRDVDYGVCEDSGHVYYDTYLTSDIGVRPAIWVKK